MAWHSGIVPGWILQVLIAIPLAGILVGFLGFVLCVVNKKSGRVPRARSAGELWRWYVEGEITREEFERLRREDLERTS